MSALSELNLPQAHWLSRTLRDVLLRDVESLPLLQTDDGTDVKLLLTQTINFVESHEFEALDLAKQAIQLRAILNERSGDGRNGR